MVLLDTEMKDIMMQWTRNPHVQQRSNIQFWGGSLLERGHFEIEKEM
jgi:hypothetical protein